MHMHKVMIASISVWMKEKADHVRAITEHGSWPCDWASARASSAFRHMTYFTGTFLRISKKKCTYSILNFKNCLKPDGTKLCQAQKLLCGVWWITFGTISITVNLDQNRRKSTHSKPNLNRLTLDNSPSSSWGATSAFTSDSIKKMGLCWGRSHGFIAAHICFISSSDSTCHDFEEYMTCSFNYTSLHLSIRR